MTLGLKLTGETKLLFLGVCFFIFIFMAPTKAEATATLNDITGHWAEYAINQAIDEGYFTGYPDGSFKPSSSITRAEFSVVFAKATGLTNEVQDFSGFSDIAPDHWAANSINSLTRLGFIDPTDYSNGFEANQPMTRYEMAKWLVNGLIRSNESFEQAFEDVKDTLLPFTEVYNEGISEEKIPYLAIARGTGLIGGYEDGSFGLEKTTTRAEVVALLTRYLNIEGTDATSYDALNELREVGTTGTNLLYMGAKPGTYLGETSSFTRMWNVELPTKNGVGTIVFHRAILVDTQGTSIYSDMFKSSLKENYALFTDVSFTPNKDLTSTSSISGSYLPFSGMHTGFLDPEYNIPTFEYSFGLPNDKYSSIPEYLQEGVTRRFWMFSSLNKGSFLSTTLPDSFILGFTLPR